MTTGRPRFGRLLMMLVTALAVTTIACSDRDDQSRSDQGDQGSTTTVARDESATDPDEEHPDEPAEPPPGLAQE